MLCRAEYSVPCRVGAVDRKGVRNSQMLHQMRTRLPKGVQFLARVLDQEGVSVVVCELV